MTFREYLNEISFGKDKKPNKIELIVNYARSHFLSWVDLDDVRDKDDFEISLISWLDRMEDDASQQDIEVTEDALENYKEVYEEILKRK